MNILVLPTEQVPIILRQLTIEDAPVYFETVDANGEHLSQRGDNTAAKYPDLQSVEQSILNPSDPDKVRMGIWNGETFVGSINLTPQEDGETATIGYWLDSRQTGHGYATLATKALSSYAAERFQRVRANVVEGNVASSRVLERSGFRQIAKEAGHLVFELAGVKPPEQQPATTIRAVQAKDLELLEPILKQWIINRTTGVLFVEEIAGVMAAVEASIQGQNDRTYVVAEDGNSTLVGIMGKAAPSQDMQPYVTSDNPVEFINAYVDKQSRGTGAGTLLAKQLEEIALQAGHTEIIVNSGPRYKDTGWPFWTKLFGEPVAVQEDLYGPGGDASVWRKYLRSLS